MQADLPWRYVSVSLNAFSHAGAPCFLICYYFRNCDRLFLVLITGRMSETSFSYKTCAQCTRSCQCSLYTSLSQEINEYMLQQWLEAERELVERDSTPPSGANVFSARCTCIEWGSVLGFRKHGGHACLEHSLGNQCINNCAQNHIQLPMTMSPFLHAHEQSCIKVLQTVDDTEMS